MACFEEAFAKTMAHEGGYANVKGDNGGETYKGIARKFHPDWSGWSIVDGCDKSDIKKLNAALATDTNLQFLVALFYQRKFWCYDKVASQDVASKLFDMAVNMGSGQAHRLLQRALVACDWPIGIDGEFGPKTLAAINQVPADKLLEALRDQSVKFYRNLVIKNPSQEKFLKGWLKRANS